jgi:hypothetical protein
MINNWLDRPAISRKIGLFLVITLGAIYLINCLSPLRISFESIRYLLLEDWMEGGFRPGAWVARDFIPYGYGYTLLLLSKLHLLHSFYIAFLNTLFLGGAIWFVRRTFRKDGAGWQWIPLVLLNWTAIKMAISPLSEMQYLFFSTGAIYFYLLFRDNGRWVTLLAALLFFVASLLTRTVGITLFIALLASLVHEFRQKLFFQAIRHKALTVSLVLSAAAIIYFAHFLRISNYMHFMEGPSVRPGFKGLLSNLSSHLAIDWAELFVNTPSAKINFLPVTLMTILFTLVGLVMLAVVVRQLLSRNFRAPILVRYYLAVYMLVIFCWPFHECRFWLPLWPFLCICLLQAAGPSNRILQKIITAATCWYLLAGVFALSYYTYTSLNREVLARTQDAGFWRKEYEAHFTHGSPPDSTGFPRNEVYYLLQKID